MFVDDFNNLINIYYFCSTLTIKPMNNYNLNVPPYSSKLKYKSTDHTKQVTSGKTV